MQLFSATRDFTLHLSTGLVAIGTALTSTDSSTFLVLVVVECLLTGLANYVVQ